MAMLLAIVLGFCGSMMSEPRRLAVTTGLQPAACAEQISDAGAQIKSLEEGLLDFPSSRDGEDVLLCWKLGEEEISYWHGLDEGFAARKPLY